MPAEFGRLTLRHPGPTVEHAAGPRAPLVVNDSFGPFFRDTHADQRVTAASSKRCDVSLAASGVNEMAKPAGPSTMTTPSSAATLLGSSWTLLPFNHNEIPDGQFRTELRAQGT